MPRVDSVPPVRDPHADIVCAAAFERADELSSVRSTCHRALVARGATSGHADAVVLIVSELSTNALCHAAAPYSTIVRRDPTGITFIEVGDCGDGDATTREPEFQRGGYGLNLVNKLAETWGVHQDHGRKIVWAVVPDERQL